MSQPWTIDSIAHAIPDPGFRQRFFSEINLAPVDQLQTVIDHWVRFIEDWKAGKPKLDAIQAHIREHGRAPAEYDVTPEMAADSDDFLARLKADTAARRQGSTAA